MFLTTCVLCSLRCVKVKTEGETTQKETIAEKLQTEIKTVVNRGLA